MVIRLITLVRVPLMLEPRTTALEYFIGSLAKKQMKN